MSHYIERCCVTHGEWQMDVDNVEECPACEREGLTEVQQLRERLVRVWEAWNKLQTYIGFKHSSLECAKLVSIIEEALHSSTQSSRDTQEQIREDALQDQLKDKEE